MTTSHDAGREAAVARLATMADHGRIDAAYGDFSHPALTMIGDVRKVLPSLTRPPAQAGAASVEVTQRQKDPADADYGEHFLTAHVSKDGSLVGIDHPCDAVWADVMTAHVALRDRINERIAAQDGCPFKPRTATPAASGEIPGGMASLAREPATADVGREGCIGSMDPKRATYFLERFKREEKWLGPHEQWAIDYTIRILAALSAAPSAPATEAGEEA